MWTSLKGEEMDLSNMEATGISDERSRSGSDPLKVRLSVRPDCENGCHHIDENSRAVRQTVTVDSSGTVRCNIAVGSDVGIRYFRSDATDQPCPGAVLATTDCIPTLEEVRDGQLIFTVLIPARDHLSEIVTRLRETGATVSVDQVLTSMDWSDSPPLLTVKQREAFETAIEAGYYEQPRGASLSDIAEKLDITASAASQRLTSVKRQLANRYARQLSMESAQSPR